MTDFDWNTEAARVLEVEGRALLEASVRFQDPQYAQTFQQAVMKLNASLEKGGKIVVTGVGKSGKIGEKISSTLVSTGSLSVYLHATEGLHGDLGLICAEDIVLAISYTGNTDEIVRLLPFLKARGVPIIALCGQSHSRLAQASDLWLDAHVSTEACPYNLAPTTSTTLSLALGDALAISLMKLRNFQPESFARNHPGGSLGRKLTFTVHDLMHTNEQVATVSPNDTVERVLLVATEKKLGAVLVVEGPKLLGIITDGDIRRTLQKREQFFEQTAQQMMNSQPVTIPSHASATAALALMENRFSQISVLPVVDSHGHWVGVLRLHDLLQSH